MNIVLGIIFVIIGGAMSIYNDKMLGTFGRVPFAEKYFQTEGGSRLFYVLLGIVVVFIGFTLIFNLYNQFMFWILSPFFRR